MTTSDKELLELAAKAAGYSMSPYWDDGTKYDVTEGPHGWNPLTDDGDALRLAVKLKIDLHHDMNEEPYVSVWIRPETKYLNLEYTDDVFADTRRAIVRAAAQVALASKEIGKTL